MTNPAATCKMVCTKQLIPSLAVGRPVIGGSADPRDIFLWRNIRMKTAILVDGGFYRRRAQNMLGEKTAEERANEITAQ